MVLDRFTRKLFFMKKLCACFNIILCIPVWALFSCDKSNGNNANTTPVNTKDSVVATGLSYVWEILWGPDDFIWFTERNGQISRMDPQTGDILPLLTVNEVVDQGEGGLLGMVVNGNTSIPQVYIVYNYTSNGYREKVVRYSFENNTLTNPTPIIDNIPAAGIHNGSRLAIVNDKLFISTGDASNTSNAQNINSLSGKILRLNLDGTIPADNPVPGNPYWSIGHRNPQGMVFANNKLYISEHGPGNDDEINIVEKNRNYGWPDVQGFCNSNSEQQYCTSNNIAEPIYAWTPTIATCGLDYYDSDRIPQWKNSLLLATLKDETLYQLKLDNNGTSVSSVSEFISGKYGRLRDVCISPAGDVYVSTSNGSNDKIIRILPE